MLVFNLVNNVFSQPLGSNFRSSPLTMSVCYFGHVHKQKLVYEIFVTFQSFGKAGWSKHRVCPQHREQPRGGLGKLHLHPPRH